MRFHGVAFFHFCFDEFVWTSALLEEGCADWFARKDLLPYIAQIKISTDRDCKLVIYLRSGMTMRMSSTAAVAEAARTFAGSTTIRVKLSSQAFGRTFETLA